MREHTHLSAVVSLVSKHVAQHFRANRPRFSPAVSMKLLDAAIAERFREHFPAASRTLGQSRAGLLRRAVPAAEPSRYLQMRGRKPDPFAAGIVHVSENRRNVAGFAGRFGFPCGGVKMFDKHLVHALTGGKDPDGGRAELRMNLGWTLDGLMRGHGLLAPYPRGV